MRYLVLTDIHANLEALDACLADARAHGYEHVLVLGDLVGYGADPNAVVNRVRALDPVAMVRGNHDKVATGLESAESFNAVARTAAIWTAGVLTAENRAWLAALPHGPREVDETVQICHGSPIDEDQYIFGWSEARAALLASTRPLCLFGHTHCAAIYQLDHGTATEAHIGPGPTSPLTLLPGVRYLVNPGATGQPRDADPRAAYAIVDTLAPRVDLIRVEYPVRVAQDKIRRAGLPAPLADRLAIGR